MEHIEKIHSVIEKSDPLSKIESLCEDYAKNLIDLKYRIQEERQKIDQMMYQKDMGFSASEAKYLKLLDNLFRAIDDICSNSGSGEEFRGYLLMRIIDVLNQEGIAQIPLNIGDPFDPNLHNAIETLQDTSFPENAVLKIVHRGYRQNEKIVKKADVTVNYRGVEE